MVSQSLNNQTIDNISDRSKPIGQDAYITATYHLLKDKLFREHHGISVTHQVLANKTTHHKKVLPNRPRKSIIKPPTFGLSTLKATEEEQEELPATESTNNAGTNGVLNLPYEEDAAFTLPLARKCSIVSEEGSCAGTDGWEGSDSVLNHSNIQSLDNDGGEIQQQQQRQTTSNIRVPHKFPVVDIIITDYSEYEPREEEEEMILQVSDGECPTFKI